MCFVAYFKENFMLIIFHIKASAWKSQDFEIIICNFLLKFFCSAEIMIIYWKCCSLGNIFWKWLSLKQKYKVLLSYNIPLKILAGVALKNCSPKAWPKRKLLHSYFQKCSLSETETSLSGKSFSKQLLMTASVVTMDLHLHDVNECSKNVFSSFSTNMKRRWLTLMRLALLSTVPLTLRSK